MRKTTIVVCINHRANPNQPSCGARGSKAIASAIETEINKHQCDVQVERIQCLGFCDRGPNIRIAPEGRFIHDVQLADVPNLIAEIVSKQNN